MTSSDSSSGSMGAGNPYLQATQLTKSPAVTQTVAAAVVTPFSKDPTKKKDRLDGAPPSAGAQPAGAEDDGDLNATILTSLAQKNKQKLLDQQQTQADADAKARVTIQNFQPPPSLVAGAADETIQKFKKGQNPDHDHTLESDEKPEHTGKAGFFSGLFGGNKKAPLQAKLGLRADRGPVDSEYYIPTAKELEEQDALRLASAQGPSDGSTPTRIASPITKNGVFLATSNTGDNLTDGILNQNDTAAASLIARTKAKPVPVDKRRFEALQNLINVERNFAEDNDPVAV